MSRINSPHILLTAQVVGEILKGRSRVSLDLGLSETTVAIEGENIVFPGGRRVKRETLHQALKRPNMVFVLLDSELHPIALADEHFYKLVPTKGAPTLEIDGIRMHRTKGTTPEADARKKVRALGVRDGKVLEIGTGLGYTTQATLEAGAEVIVSIELSPAVLKIAQLNPWSRRLFVDERIHLILGDAYHILPSLHSEFFDYVLHDPPRFPLAGHLYGSAFYTQLFRVLKPGGRLFHYVGEPGARYRGRNIRRGVMNRLRGAGFTEVLYHRGVRGITCTKANL